MDNTFLVVATDLYYTSTGIIALSVLGSIFSFVVFSRKQFQKSSISLYCKWLAIFDLYLLFNLVICLINILGNIDLTNTSQIVCKLVYLFSIGISPMPGWVLVAFSIDQLIAVSKTKRFKFVNKKLFQYGVISGIFFVNLAIYSPVFWLSGLLIANSGNSTITYCNMVPSIMPYVYLLESSLIPFAIMLVTTTLIIRLLIQLRKRIANEISTDDSRRTHNLKFGFNSAILNIIFILFSTPIVVYYMLPKGNYYVNYFIQNLSLVFFYSNFALHFWIHLIVNSIFRNEFLILLRIRKP